MLSMLSKKTVTLLTLLILAFASYIAINGQQARQVALNNEENDQVNIPAKARGVSAHPATKASHPRLSQPLAPPQVEAGHKLSPQDWLTNFKAAYPSGDAIKKMMTGINLEQHPEFIEQLLLQVQFLPEADTVRTALENPLIMRLTSLDPPRAADYVLAALAQQKQTSKASLNPFQPGNNPTLAMQPFNMTAQHFMMGHQLVSSLMQAWGKKDLPQAIDWALALDDEKIKHEALNLLSYTRDEYKIDQIADVINQLPKDNVRSGLLTQLAEQKAQIDPDAAVNWVSNWPDSPERNQAISALISTRTSQSLEDTATLVERVLTAGMNPDDTAIDMLVNQWQYKSPTDAYQWAVNLPNGAVKTRALLLLDAMREQNREE